MKIVRKKTRQIQVGGVAVGGDALVSVQSMIKAPPHDLSAVMRQVRALEREGCEIVRLAVPDAKAVRVFAAAMERASTPLVADIHFNAKLAIQSLDAGAACVRINPGNMGGRAPFLDVIRAAKNAGAAVRIGVNSGSLEKDILKKHGGPSPEALCESALRWCEVADNKSFKDYKVSLKTADPADTIEAYRMFSQKSDAPLHIGVTEAGRASAGLVRSAVGIGVLLAEGIGDTLRVSLSGPAAEEVRAGWRILSALGIRHRGVTVISCPACGRAGADVEKIAGRVERLTAHIATPLKIAVMGCAVNGPGEARKADLGAAFAGPRALIFAKGKDIKRVKAGEAATELARLAGALAAKSE